MSDNSWTFTGTVRHRALLLSSPLPYHGPQHAVAVSARALQLAGDVVLAGTQVDLAVVEAAALLHDAGYGDPHITAASKEAHSAQLAAMLLGELGAPTTFVDRVVACILATEHTADPQGVEEQLVRAADLFDLGNSFAVFAAHNDALRKEAALLEGRPVTDAEWVRRTVTAVEGFHQRPYRLPGATGDPTQTTWHARVRTNLDTWVAQDG